MREVTEAESWSATTMYEEAGSAEGSWSERDLAAALDFEEEAEASERRVARMEASGRSFERSDSAYDAAAEGRGFLELDAGPAALAPARRFFSDMAKAERPEGGGRSEEMWDFGRAPRRRRRGLSSSAATVCFGWGEGDRRRASRSRLG